MDIINYKMTLDSTINDCIYHTAVNDFHYIMVESSPLNIRHTCFNGIFSHQNKT